MTSPGSSRRGVLFDVDGTLIDNTYVHVVAWWQAFDERGYDVRMSNIHTAIGKGSEELVQAVVGQPDPSVIEAHSRYYGPHLGRVRPFTGAAKLLRTTAESGLTVVLASSRGELR